MTAFFTSSGSQFLSHPVFARAMHTGAANEDSLASRSNLSGPWSKAEMDASDLFQMNQQLLAEGLVPPTLVASNLLPLIFRFMRKQCFKAPSRISPDGDGGICIEWIDREQNEMLRTITIRAKGDVELIHFTNNRVSSRQFV